ncbi:hemicentin-1-like [Lytechinus variegatus]|uniref:hemicentin-1-like n=1 Tax=Lytechinus variegatus TaxID=7654 RepID=UPI001BB14C09|nr:hemicentin-1-like [Lytechinus variegatus]
MECESQISESPLEWPEELNCDTLPSYNPERKTPKCIHYEPPKPAFCRLHKEIGPCSTYHPFWYFDRVAKTCQTFTYGGCLGNKNRFETKEACIRTCGQESTIAPGMLSTTLDITSNEATTPPPLPRVLERPMDQTVFEGETVTLNCFASGALEYAWRRIAGPMPEHKILAEEYSREGAILIIADMMPEDAGLYMCIAENQAGVEESVASITVLVPPRIVKFPESALIIQGETLELKCEFSGVPPPKVYWEREDGQFVSQRVNGTESTVIISEINDIQSGMRFTCVGRNEAGLDKRFIDVEVRVPPYFTAFARNRTLNEGETADFLCQAEGTRPLTISWYKDGSPLVPDGSRTMFFENGTGFHITSTTPSDTGRYTCSASNSVGQIVDDVYFQVIAAAALPRIVERPSNATVYIGQSTRFQCQGAGDPAPTVSWLVDGFTIGVPPLDRDMRYTFNGTDLVITHVNVRDAGKYTCLVSSPHGIERASAHLFIREPTLEMETAISDTNVIIGDDLVLTCEAHGEPEPSLTWYRNGLPINDTLQSFSIKENSIIIPILTTKMGGSYKCIYDNGVLTASSSAMVEILEPTAHTPATSMPPPMSNSTTVTPPPSRTNGISDPDLSDLGTAPSPLMELKLRRYDVTDTGIPDLFRGWADVQGQGAANDYCRVIEPEEGQYQLSCVLAGSEGEVKGNYTTRLGFDVGERNTWYMKDEDGDGRDDYCRCMREAGQGRWVYCTKAGTNGFYGNPDAEEFETNEVTFRAPGPEDELRKCRKRRVDPFFGLPETVE